jgi:hypothetical protein
MSEVISSLTGQTMLEELASVTPAAPSRIVPSLLLGVGFRVVPAMLECRRRGADFLMRAIETGNHDILRRGGVDEAAMLRAAIEVAPGSVIAIDELGSILSF